MRSTILRYGQLLLVAWGVSLGADSNAQLTVSPQTNVLELAAAITGPGVRIANPVIVCHAQGYGEFNYTGSLLGVDAGVLLTTGRISNAVGPNNADNTSFQQNTGGNALLNTVTGRTTYDACRLEFDVIPGGDTLRFNFAFASEEYNEWVGSQYNDVFGFFISGPGIIGDPGIGNEKNIALIPGTQQAVTINNVNNGSNQAHFFDNAGGQHLQYDGFTKGLQAVAVVEPCQTYRLKLIVADASDRKLDSGVFIERIESNAVTIEAVTATGYPNLVEGCHSGLIRFTRQVVTSDPLDVPYFLSGTATNGVDHNLIGDPDPAVAKVATIPGGQSSVEVHFNPIADGVVEGSEFIRVLLGSSLCPGYYLDSLDIFIQDSLVAQISPATTICPGTSTTLTASGGLNYAWSPTTGLATPSAASTTASPSSTTTYTVVASVASCQASASTVVTVSTMSLSAIRTKPLCQGQTNGAINLSVTGGTAPFSFTWTGPNGFNASSEDLVGIGAGTYTVTVIDGASCSVSQSFNLNTPSALVLATMPSILPLGQNIACFGGADGSIELSINGGTAPYQIAWTGPNGFTSNNEDLSALLAGSYSVLVTDLNGCTATTDRSLVQAPLLSATLSNITAASCSAASDGAATVTISGGTPPYSYAWNTSPAQTSATATGLPAGSHTCTITDGYGCGIEVSAMISAPTPVTVSITDVANVRQCQGQQDPSGSASALASGGIAPYSYLWNTSPAQAAAVVDLNAAGTYTVVATDGNGCTGSAEVSVTQLSPSSIAVTAQTNVSCAAIDSGSATVAATGSSAQSIVWNTVPPQSGASATGLTPGSYTATALHADGCQSTTSAIISGPSQTLSVSIDNISGVSCYTDQNGAASALAIGGTAPYSYSWNSTPAQSTASASGLAAGMASVTVTDALGCSAQADAMIPGPAAALQVSIASFNNALCFEGNEGSATALATGGSAPYNYVWNSTPAQSGATATGLIAGTYTVTATDAHGCSAATQMSLTAPDVALLALVESFSDVTCFGDSDGSATVSIIGGSGSYSITWMVQPPQSGISISGLSPGMYMAEVMDTNGCSTQKMVPFTIGAPSAPLQLDFVLSEHSGYNTSCYTTADGSIDVTVSGGYAPYSYQWSDLHGSVNGAEDLSGLDADTYILEVTDARGCTIDSTLVLTAPPEIVVVANITTAACQGSATGAVAITASGGIAPLAFNWSGPNGFSSANASISGLASGIYTLSISDGHGCIVTRSYDVSEPGIFNVSTTLSEFPGSWNVSCAAATDGSITLSTSGGTGALSYTWNGPSILDPAQQDQSGLAAGSYTVMIADENGCSTLASYTLSAPQTFATSLQPGLYGTFNTSCAGAEDGFINASITGGTVLYDIAWTGPDGFTASTTNIFDLAPGSYTLTASDANGCSTSATRTLLAPTALSATLAPATSTSGDAIACHGASTGSIDLTLTGGAQPYSTSWQGPNGFNSTAQDISGLVAGTYALTVSDSNGCTEVLPIELTEPDPIVINTTIADYNGAALSCFGATNGSISTSVLGGAGAITLSWSGPNSFSSNAANISNLGAGSYALTVLDENGCSNSATIDLVAPEPLSNAFALSDHLGHAISCDGAADGTISLSTSGGTAPYSIEWSGPNGFTSTSSELDDLEAGLYSLSVSDANGCTIQSGVELEQPMPISIALLPSAYAGGYNISCSGASDGSVNMSVDGGTAPYTVAWSDGLGFTSPDEDLVNIGAGIYEVIVTDANGCSAAAQANLSAPDALGISATLSGTPGANIACAGASDGSILLDLVGGTLPYTTTWSNGSSGIELQNVGAGSYSVEVTDANGCSATGTYILEAPQSVFVELTASQHPSGFALACADGTDGQIEGAVTGGTPGYDHAWSGPNGPIAGTSSIGNLGVGSYTLVVTDANGCSGSSTITLNAPQPISLVATAVSYNGGYHITCMGESNGQASASASGGSAPYTFSWTGANGFTADGTMIDTVLAGSYVVSVTDSYGCSASSSIELIEPSALDLDLTLSDVVQGYHVGCDNNDGSITAIASGGTPDHTFSWTNDSGFGSADQTISGLSAGIYQIVLSDANGCEFAANATLLQADGITVEFTSTPNTCPGDAIGTISTVVNGGVAPYQFHWVGSNGTVGSDQDLAGLEAGSYTLSVSDALGCSADFNAQVTGPAAITSGAYLSFYGQYNLQCAGDASGVIELQPTGGTAPHTLTVSGPNGFTSTSSSLSGLVAGSYAIAIVDANGCALDTTVTLTAPELSIQTTLSVSIYASGTNVSCNGGSDGWIQATVDGGVGPYQFTWRGPDSLEFDTSDINGLTAGNYAYELVVTDGNQCSFFTEVTLTEPDSPLVAQVTTSAFDGGHQVSCAGAVDGSIALDISGGNGGYTIDWQGPNGFSGQGATLQDQQSGDYLATITDINGCSLQVDVTLGAPDPLSIALDAFTYPGGTQISCANANDGSVIATIGGGTSAYSSAWTGPNGYSAADTSIAALAPGTYCLVATDANGCAQQACITIAAPEVLAAAANPTAAACGEDVGAVDLNVSGGSLPYTYQWSNGSISEDLNSLAAGDYSVSVTDANGCGATTVAEVIGTPAVLAVGTVTHNACSGGSAGSISLETTSGTAPFDYLWSTGETNSQLSGLSAGTRTVSITDSNGCTFTTAFTITESAPITIEGDLSMHTGGYNVSTWGGNDGSILIQVDGGSPAYSYSWSNGASSPAINDLQAGSYAVEVSDSNGCTASVVFVLDQPEDLIMPTGYSPNGDGANDSFFIRGLDAYPSNTFVVLNRWGNVVYDRLNYRNDWNGENIQGQMLPNGTYFVILTVKNGERTLQGYVDLRR